MAISLKVNGATRSVDAEPDTPLLYVLRNDLELNGAKYGCGMNYNEFGHLRPEDKELALGEQIGPKSVITYPSGSQQLPGPGFYEISGLAWSGGGAVKTVEVSTDGGKTWNRAQFKNTPQRMQPPMPWPPSAEMGIRYSGFLCTAVPGHIWPGRATYMDSARWAGTKTSLQRTVLLLVARMPSVCQSSTTSYCERCSRQYM